jgi:hypothetical protein
MGVKKCSFHNPVARQRLSKPLAETNTLALIFFSGRTIRLGVFYVVVSTLIRRTKARELGAF